MAPSCTGHSDDGWILDGLKFGFHIQYRGPPRYNTEPTYNHSSAVQHPDTIRRYIAKETELGALHGPYDAPPFTPWMTISPLMTRQKPDSLERRVIVDLSYPEGGSTPSLPHTNLMGHQRATACQQLTTPWRQWPLHAQGRSTWRWLISRGPTASSRFPHRTGPSWAFTTRASIILMAGCPSVRACLHSSCSLSQASPCALGVNNTRAFMYLDDNLLISNNHQLAQRQYQDTLTLLGKLGLQVAVKKLQPPGRWYGWASQLIWT